MLIHKQVNELARAVGRELKNTNRRIDDLSVKVKLKLKNRTPYTIGGNQLILLDEDLKPNSITNAQTPNTDKQRYRGGFKLEHIYFYSGDKVRPYNFFERGKLYSRYSGMDFKFSSNCGMLLEPNKPVYLICGYDEDTNLYYLAKKWWTQKLPEKDDGLIYKHIGFAGINQSLQFVNDGPVYQFKKGKVLVSESGPDKDIQADKVLDSTSLNPVSNQAVTEAVQTLNERIDTIVIEGVDIDLADIINHFDNTYSSSSAGNNSTETDVNP